MNITISKANNCLCLHSKDKKYVEFVMAKHNEFADYHSWNTDPRATMELFCYDIALFEVMHKIAEYGNNVMNVPVVFDVE